MHEQDTALVGKVLSGDEGSFNVLYDTFFPKIYRFCRMRLKDEDTVKDAVQQTFISAMKGLKNYRGEASLHTWLCQIARREIYAWYKRSGEKQEITKSIDHNPDLRAALESIPDLLYDTDVENDLSEIVQMSLDALPSSYGAALELKYIEGFSVSEIAKHLDTGEIAVQSLLARARKAFKEIFSEFTKEFSAI